MGKPIMHEPRVHKQIISGNFQLETNQLVLTLSPDLASSTPFNLVPKQAY